MVDQYNKNNWIGKSDTNIPTYPPGSMPSSVTEQTVSSGSKLTPNTSTIESGTEGNNNLQHVCFMSIFLDKSNYLQKKLRASMEYC